MDGEILNNTLLNYDKLLVIRQCAENVRRLGIPGATAELGVFRGGGSKLISSELPDRTHYAFDSFEGLQDCDPAVDRHNNNDFAAVNVDNVKALLSASNVIVCVGRFPESAARVPEEQYALVHLDADTYASTLAGLKYFYPRMSPGGIIVLDDYRWHQCPGVEQALLEYMADKPEPVEFLTENQALILKQPTESRVYRVWFDHGLGDCVHFSQILQLYRRRNYLVSVHFHANTHEIWRGAGFPFTPVSTATHHPFIYPPGFNVPSPHADFAGSKTFGNIQLSPLPQLSDKSAPELWEELVACDERDRMFAFLGGDALIAADRYLSDLPRPLVLVHPAGTNYGSAKNIPTDSLLDLYALLLDQSDCGIVLVDWDFRVPTPDNFRVRHLARDFGHVSTGQFLALAQRADLFIGVDSGPLHAALFTDVPVLGVFHGHYPTCVTLPNPRAAFMARGTPEYLPINQSRRARWSLLEYPSRAPTGADIARHALRMLDGPRYLTKSRFGRDMLLQQFVRDWLTTGERQRTMDAVLRLTSRRFQSPNVVETGCQEKPEDWQEGSSTYLWGAYLDGRDAGHLSSVARAPARLGAARDICAPWNTRISYHAADPVAWLSQYRRLIDVLYLNATPADAPEAAESALQEFQAALPKLSPDAVVIVDDAQRVGVRGAHGSERPGGRAEKILPFALERGWRVMASGVQLVLTRNVSKDFSHVS